MEARCKNKLLPETIALNFFFLNAEFFAAPLAHWELFQQWAEQITRQQSTQQNTDENDLQKLSLNLQNVLFPSQFIHFAHAISGYVYNDMNQIQRGHYLRKERGCLLHNHTEPLENILKTNKALVDAVLEISQQESLLDTIESWYKTEAPKPTKERMLLRALRTQLQKIHAVLETDDVCKLITVFSQFGTYLKLNFDTKEQLGLSLKTYRPFLSMMPFPNLANITILRKGIAVDALDNPHGLTMRTHLLKAIRSFHLLMGPKRCRNFYESLNDLGELEYQEYKETLVTAYLRLQNARWESVTRYIPDLFRMDTIFKSCIELQEKAVENEQNNNDEDADFLSGCAIMLGMAVRDLALAAVENRDCSEQASTITTFISYIEKIVALNPQVKATNVARTRFYDYIADHCEAYMNEDIDLQQLCEKIGKIAEIDTTNILNFRCAENRSTLWSRAKRLISWSNPEWVALTEQHRTEEKENIQPAAKI